MTVILVDGGNWNEINVLTSNFILLGDKLLDEIPYRHTISFYKFPFLILLSGDRPMSQLKKQSLGMDAENSPSFKTENLMEKIL